MEKYKNSVIKFFKTPKFIIPIIIVAIASFGYLFSHSTVNGDVLSADRYFESTELIAQQRLLTPILDKIFNIENFYPFLVDFIAVIFLIIASVLYCALFDVVSKGKIKTIAFTIFSCFFVSYPLIMEYFTFVPMGLNVSIGFCLVAISLMLFTEGLLVNNRKFYIYTRDTLIMCYINI